MLGFLKLAAACLVSSVGLISCGSSESTNEDVSKQESHHDHSHSELTEYQSDERPKLSLSVTADPVVGVNIHISSDLDVVPSAASGKHVNGEGHFHLLVNGSKVLRFYNEWIHYSDLEPGVNVVAVEMATNDHSIYSWQGEKLRAEVLVERTEVSGHHHHSAESIEFVGEKPALSIDVSEDPMSGWNVHLEYSGIEIDPFTGGGKHRDGAGHLHLYANGQKLSRLYGRDTHVPELPKGEVELSVGFYNNEHLPFTWNGQPIVATTVVMNQ